MRHQLTILPIPLPRWLEIIESLNVAERSAFTYLVAAYCRDGGLPNDDKVLAQIARVSMRTWLHMRPRLALKFPVEGWRWPEIDQCIARRQKITGIKSAAGTKGNFVRWHGLQGKTSASHAPKFSRKPLS